MRIRRAREEDLRALAGIFARAATYLVERYRPEQVGVFSVEPEERLPVYRHLLGTGAVFVAEDPEPVGFSAAVIRDGTWFLSQLWVLPERHASGIGSMLLDEALAWGRGCRVFSVVSSPHPAAQLMYLRASMFPLWVEHEMTGSDLPVAEPPEGIEPIQEADQGWVTELDREVRGIARPEDHAFWRSNARGLSLRRGGHRAGYVYVWPNGKVGPGAVRDPTDTPMLIRAARHLAGGPATFAVPSTNWAAIGELVRSGFSPFGSTTFMASRGLGDGSRYLSGGGALG
ncbi:MAG: GNAT family N-acetyltransferase [Actinomycetota bacterium]